MAEDRATVRFRRNLVSPSVPPKPLHHAFFTRVGMDIMLDLGHFDLPEVRDVLEQPRQNQSELPMVTLHVTDRFVLTPQDAHALWETVQQLAQDLKAKGLWPSEGTTEEVH